ncbi:sugar O-acetyltransferase [Clostridium tunisiense]|uniref:sugar O-acetyltransferase n=1 Tax=Clostridium tunisiense TaxID=219748 RepID=UPI00031FAA3F|nr:sugar O-acetyltransferase [Clostridium tunisiense]
MNFEEKMKMNKPYISKYEDMDPTLKTNARNLLWEFNNTKPDDNERRQEILRELFGSCTPMTFIEPTFRCDYGFNIHFSGMAVINYNCVMLDTSPIHVGKNVFIGPGTCISCAGHAVDSKQRAEGIGDSKPITIKDDVWIGANCTILGGVTIGEGSIVGAGSVVTKDIPAGVIAVGNPCKVLREITIEDKWNLCE